MTPQAAHVRSCMRPLGITATGMTAKRPRLRGVKAVVFDLYGTLLISSAGAPSQEPLPDMEGWPGSGIRLREVIEDHHRRAREAGLDHPEVEIREVWGEVLNSLGGASISRQEIEWLILRHECRVHPTWPMPGAPELLIRLREAGFLLGIVSNAQFYTLALIEGLFGGTLDDLGFHPQLRVFSYEIGEGKPSSRLFLRLVEEAAALGVAAEEIFYLGNDFSKDVLPARAAGMRTGWFAGDRASFRSGAIPVEEAAELADAVITHLDQVPELFLDGPLSP